MSQLPQHLPGNHAAARLSLVDDDRKAQLELLGPRRNSLIGFVVPCSPQLDISKQHQPAVDQRESEQVDSNMAPVETQDGRLGQRIGHAAVGSTVQLQELTERTDQLVITGLRSSEPDGSCLSSEAGRCELRAERERKDREHKAFHSSGAEVQPQSWQHPLTVSKGAPCLKQQGTIY